MKLSTSLQRFRYKQYICVFIVTLLEASAGMSGLWLSPVLPQLTADDCPLGVKLTAEEISWLVSSEKLGAVAGCMISAYLIDKIGRRPVLLFAAVPFFLSSFISAFITLPAVLISMRVVFGIGLGCCFVGTHLYIGEVADKDIRGQLGLMQSVMGTLGGMFPLTAGPFVSYKALTLTTSVFPALFVVLFIFMPETPYFLVKINKIEAANKAMYRLSAKDQGDRCIVPRLHEIQTSVANDLSNQISLWEMFTNDNYRKALLINAVLRTVLNFSGALVINSYFQVIVASSGSTMSPEISSILFGVIQLPSVILATALVDRSGRRPLYIASTLGSGITIATLGIYFFLQDYVQADVTNISWLPITSLSLYVFLLYLGIFVIPRVSMAEFFPINMKAVASSFLAIYGSVLGFIIAMLYQPIETHWGLYTLFWIFAAACFLACFFGIFLLPETKGKSFIEIQSMLSGYKKK